LVSRVSIEPLELHKPLTERLTRRVTTSSNNAEEDRPNDWGSVDEALKELTRMLPVLSSDPITHEGVRSFVRWLFGWLEMITFSLKRIALSHAERNKVELSQREVAVLTVMAERAFPGMPPPRRIELLMRESLSTALNVYARARKKTSPLEDGILPQIFITASRIHDRLLHPNRPEDLRLSREEMQAIAEFVRWFETIRQWLFRDRLDEIEEIKAEVSASTEALRKKILGTE
jgi:hypothetical protein